MNIIKILAVKYPQAQDRNNPTDNINHLHRVVEVIETDIRKTIGELLFNISEFYRYNYCLIRFDNKMYVIEPANRENALYVKRLVSYHPLSHLVAS